MVETLFEDIFVVDKLDPDGKKFDKVSRIEAMSEQFDMYMQLDVNTEIYRMHVGEKFMMVLASTLNLDGTPDSGYYTQVENTRIIPVIRKLGRPGKSTFLWFKRVEAKGKWQLVAHVMSDTPKICCKTYELKWVYRKIDQRSIICDFRRKMVEACLPLSDALRDRWREIKLMGDFRAKNFNSESTILK
ncbi:unnamed protein product [Ilex paraguariensis]|uniref:Uncharacterized protein n=1 Tax=Ilex paraguariensis TaxID=185542 RepID=A0ABC8QQ72_9AQUA